MTRLSGRLMARKHTSVKPGRKYDRSGGPQAFKTEAVRRVTIANRRVPE